jgi:two-component system cell cycle sensor histidine kinase/response regulator CckA
LITPAAETGPTILVVEDDEGVRVVVDRILTRHGYRVLSARDANEALAVAERHAAAVQLVITDLVLPRVNGRALVDELARRGVRAPALFISGYGEADIEQRGLADIAKPLLRKPFTPKQLLSAIRDRLAAH